MQTNVKYNDEPTELNYCRWLEANAQKYGEMKVNGRTASFWNRVRRQLIQAGMRDMQGYAVSQIADLGNHYRNIRTALDSTNE